MTADGVMVQFLEHYSIDDHVRTVLHDNLDQITEVSAVLALMPTDRVTERVKLILDLSIMLTTASIAHLIGALRLEIMTHD